MQKREIVAIYLNNLWDLGHKIIWPFGFYVGQTLFPITVSLLGAVCSCHTSLWVPVKFPNWLWSAWEPCSIWCSSVFSGCSGLAFIILGSGLVVALCTLMHELWITWWKHLLAFCFILIVLMCLSYYWIGLYYTGLWSDCLVVACVGSCINFYHLISTLNGITLIAVFKWLLLFFVGCFAKP